MYRNLGLCTCTCNYKRQGEWIHLYQTEKPLLKKVSCLKGKNLLRGNYCFPFRADAVIAPDNTGYQVNIVIISPQKCILRFSLQEPRRGAYYEYHNICFHREKKKSFVLPGAMPIRMDSGSVLHIKVDSGATHLITMDSGTTHFIRMDSGTTNLIMMDTGAKHLIRMYSGATHLIMMAS